MGRRTRQLLAQPRVFRKLLICTERRTRLSRPTSPWRMRSSSADSSARPGPPTDGTPDSTPTTTSIRVISKPVTRENSDGTSQWIPPPPGCMSMLRMPGVIQHSRSPASQEIMRAAAPGREATSLRSFHKKRFQLLFSNSLALFRCAALNQ